MNIALISDKSVAGDIDHNLAKMQHHAKALSQKVDMISFGEAYLQGFNALSWNYQHDKKIALSLDSHTIQMIKHTAKEYQIAIAFGFFEHDEKTNAIYCSYMVIDGQGECIDHYRRVSVGWKNHHKTDDHYKEGNHFHQFQYKDKHIVIALCGDLWYEENIDDINAIDKDFVLWPLHIDYTIDKWTNELDLYKKQTGKINAPVLMVNNISKRSFGGCYHFKGGCVLDHFSMGKEGILVIEV